MSLKLEYHVVRWLTVICVLISIAAAIWSSLAWFLLFAGAACLGMWRLNCISLQIYRQIDKFLSQSHLYGWAASHCLTQTYRDFEKWLAEQEKGKS